jgi:folate-dependent phosphoribosylglycinamide formyltransferase PurN
VNILRRSRSRRCGRKGAKKKEKAIGKEFKRKASKSETGRASQKMKKSATLGRFNAGFRSEERPCLLMSNRPLHEAPFKPSKFDDQRILFLGNSYSPSSTACLQSLVELGYAPMVASYDPFTKNIWRLFRNSLKSQGWGPVLRKAADVMRCKTRIALRRGGFPLSSFVSLPELTLTLGLKAVRCVHPNSAEFVEKVRLLGVDLIVVAVLSCVLKKELIGVPRLGCVNVHLSLLPRYRGPRPFYWVLANRETTTGVTLHYVDEGIDSGDIILQRELPILPDDTEFTLSDRSAPVMAALLHEAIPLLLAGKAPRIRQGSSKASYYSFPPRRPLIPGRRNRAHASAKGYNWRGHSLFRGGPTRTI